MCITVSQVAALRYCKSAHLSDLARVAMRSKGMIDKRSMENQELQTRVKS